MKKIKPWSERWEFENKGADRAKNEEISELRARVFELEVALRFYSNPEVYRPDATGRCDDLTFVARAALEGSVMTLREALIRAERKLSAYVGVCKDDKELTGAILPMIRTALAEPVPEMTRERAQALLDQHWPTGDSWMEMGDRVVDAIIAAHAEGFRAGQAAAIPEGWVLVPKVPTEKMIEAMRKGPADYHFRDIFDQINAAYCRAIAAAPTPPKGEV